MKNGGHLGERYVQGLFKSGFRFPIAITVSEISSTFQIPLSAIFTPIPITSGGFPVDFRFISGSFFLKKTDERCGQLS